MNKKLHIITIFWHAAVHGAVPRVAPAEPEWKLSERPSHAGGARAAQKRKSESEEMEISTPKKKTKQAEEDTITKTIKENKKMKRRIKIENKISNSIADQCVKKESFFKFEVIKKNFFNCVNLINSTVSIINALDVVYRKGTILLTWYNS